MPDLRKLRSPALIRKALRRRLFARRMRRIRAAWVPGLERLGSEYGGWVVPAGMIGSGWLCYSAGAGFDVSFDMALLARGARVRAFDPLDIFRDMAVREAGGDPRYSFSEVAIATEDGPVTMFGRQDEEIGSVSAVNLYGVETTHEIPGRALPSLMDEHGDERVDLLKLDIEGSEYEVLDRLDLPSLGVKVLCVELHENASPRRAKSLLGSIAEQGYEIVHTGEESNFTLLSRELAAHARAAA